MFPSLHRQQYYSTFSSPSVLTVGSVHVEFFRRIWYSCLKILKGISKLRARIIFLHYAPIDFNQGIRNFNVKTIVRCITTRRLEKTGRIFWIS